MRHVIVPYQFSFQRSAGFHQVAAHLGYGSVIAAGAYSRTPDRDRAFSWSPGQARNNGALIIAPSIDPIVFNDADSICPLKQIDEALRLAEEAPGLVFAYDLYCRLSPKATGKYLVDPPEDLFELPVEWTMPNSGSMACVAISRACFEEVGGFDETYVGWGYEDLDFAQRCNKLWPNRRVTGPVYHLWHGERNADDSPADSDPAQVAANLERWANG